MTWVDILVVVIIAAMVVSRFVKFPLPKDTRPKTQRKGWQEVIDKFRTPQPKPAKPAKAAEESKATRLRTKGRLVIPKGLTGLPAIKAVEPTFSEGKFLAGAKEAYTYFHQQWANHSEEGLQKLCAPRLLEDVLEGGLGKAPGKPSAIKSAVLTTARLNGRTAIIEVDFTATHGKKTLKSHWVFARAVGAEDPNWELQSIK